MPEAVQLGTPVESYATRVRIGTADACTYSADEIPDIVTILDETGRPRYTNAACRRLLGYDFAELGARTSEYIHPADIEVLRAEVVRLINTPGSRWNFEFRIAHANGSWRHFQTFGSNLVDDPRVQAVILHSRDITALREAEDRLEHERFHDPLTGFPTRQLFTEHLRRALRRAARLGTTLAVFGVDINSLGLVNEHGGFARGDEVLVRVGHDLEGVLRAYDTLALGDPVVARLEGAFFVLCEDVADAGGAATIAARLTASVRDGAVTSSGNSVIVTATVGVAMSSLGESNAESLLDDATSAMHLGKGRGGDRVEFFDKAIHELAEQRSAALNDLRAAITHDQLRLLYQPKVDIGTGELRGVEALVRWQHPTRGLVAPALFIPLAEESGLIHPLGVWVLEEACRQRALWSRLIGKPGELVMSVNVSSDQFDSTFPDLVNRVLEETAIAPGALCIEVTETVVMSDVEATIATMTQLRTLGVKMSIDDFGIGYSSLGQLRRLPIDELKIDQSFVDRLGKGHEDNAIVAAIIAMADALDLSVVAEGVETSEQLEQLRDLGCEQAQGFLFSRPVAPDVIADMISSGTSLRPA